MTTFAPTNPYPEKGVNTFERTMAPSITGNKGPLRFEEGVANDTDVPSDFSRGAYQDTAPASGRANVPAAESVFKRAGETMRERAHVGSASWVESPEVLGDFMQGAHSGQSMPTFEYAYNSGGYQARPAATRISW